MHLADFKKTYLTATLKGAGPAWEVGESADYEVTLYDYTDFDLKSMNVFLNILNPPNVTNPGGVEIKNPPGYSIPLGDVGYGQSKTVTLKLRATRGGPVMIALGISGFIGTFKPNLYYQGDVWNGTSWVYKSNWRNQFTIYG